MNGDERSRVRLAIARGQIERDSSLAIAANRGARITVDVSYAKSRACRAYMLDAVRRAFPGADVLPGERSNGADVSGNEIAHEAHQIADDAYEEWSRRESNSHARTGTGA